MNLLNKSRQKIIQIMNDLSWQEEPINIITARTLTPEEAIGSPERSDYPILKGKEVMVDAEFRGSRGQAYTDSPGVYQGTLGNVMDLPLTDNFQRAVFVASVNALLRSLGRIDKTVHCRDSEPGQCADDLIDYIRGRFGDPKIAFFGLQPGMVSALSKQFRIRVADLDTDNIGRSFEGTVVEDTVFTRDIIDWCDILLATGSTVVNNSAESFFVSKPLIFYGVTISGIAYLNGLEHYCSCGH